MHDRIATIGPIAAVAGPLGLAVAALGQTRLARSRRDDDTCRRPVSSTHGHATPDPTADSTTDATTRGTTL